MGFNGIYDTITGNVMANHALNAKFSDPPKRCSIQHRLRLVCALLRHRHALLRCNNRPQHQVGPPYHVISPSWTLTPCADPNPNVLSRARLPCCVSPYRPCGVGAGCYHGHITLFWCWACAVLSCVVCIAVNCVCVFASKLCELFPLAISRRGVGG